jgi:hypothetical protein
MASCKPLLKLGDEFSLGLPAFLEFSRIERRVFFEVFQSILHKNLEVLLGDGRPW